MNCPQKTGGVRLRQTLVQPGLVSGLLQVADFPHLVIMNINQDFNSFIQLGHQKFEARDRGRLTGGRDVHIRRYRLPLASPDAPIVSVNAV